MSELEITYTDNINAGTASVTVAAKPDSKRYTGSVTGMFTVRPIARDVTDYDALQDSILCGNYSPVRLTRHIEVPAGQTLTVPQGVELYIGAFNLTVYGDCVVDGRVTVYDGYGSEWHGTTTNRGTISVQRGRLNICGDFIDDGKIYGTGVYVNAPPTGDGTHDNVTVRTSIEGKAALEYEEAEFTGQAFCPRVTVTVDGKAVEQSRHFSVAYADNVNAGTASVTVTAASFSDALFGSTTLNFTVGRGQITVENEDSLKAALQNPNYDRIRLNTVTKLYDPVTVPNGVTLTVDCHYLEMHDLTVNGEVVVPKDGKVKIDGVENRGRFVNCGKTALTRTTAASGSGEYANEGDLFINGAAANGTTFDNGGAIYVRDETTRRVCLDRDGGSTTVLTPITANDVHLAESAVTYDGLSHTPAPVFACAVGVEEYDCTVAYVSTDSGPKAPTEAGNINVRYSFTPFSRTFYGEIELPYRIAPASITVYDSAALKNAVARNRFYYYNYAVITVDFNCVLTDAFTVPQGVEVIVPTGKSILYKSDLTANGKLTVNGSLIDGTGKASINRFGENTVTVSGSAYFNGVRPSGVSGSGEIFVRQSIDEATLTVANSVVYDGAPCTPDVSLVLNGAAVADSDFAVAYRNNEHISVDNYSPAQSIVTAVDRSTGLYGTRAATFIIVAGTCHVETFTDFVQKLEDSRPGSNLCNWKTITVTADLSTVYNAKVDRYVEIKPNTAVIMTTHTISIDNDGSVGNRGRLYIRNRGTVEVEYAGNMVWINPTYYRGDGEIVGDVGSLDAFRHFVNHCNHIRLTADIALDRTTVMDKIGKRFPTNYACAQYTFTQWMLDLNGHSFKSGYANEPTLLLDVSRIPVAVLSTGSTGTLGAIEVTGTAADRKLTLENLILQSVTYATAADEKNTVVRSCTAA